jgi:glyoxylase-like metal-dependent hydrolase (beta-lactamase superfamily II)
MPLNRLRSLLVLFNLIFLVVAAVPSRAVPAVQYEVYAVRFASLPGCPVHFLVEEKDDGRKIDLAMTFWVIKGGGKVILFDSGFYRDKVRKDYPSKDFMRPTEALGELKIKPEEVTDVVISHIHNDHVDGVDLFPKARVWMQKEEYEHYVSDPLRTGKKVEDAEPDDVAVLARISKVGRMTLVKGDNQEIFPGITGYIGGKHTWQSQYLGVQTRRGIVVLASDNVYLFENVEKHLPITRTLDVKSNLAAQDRMKVLAASRDLIIPGHDPKVFSRFPKVSPHVVRID